MGPLCGAPAHLFVYCISLSKLVWCHDMLQRMTQLLSCALHQGQPCCVAEAHLEAGEHSTHVLDLVSSSSIPESPGRENDDDGAQGPGQQHQHHPGFDRQCHLEVVRQVGKGRAVLQKGLIKLELG